MRKLTIFACFLAAARCAAAAETELPEGYWTRERSQPILDTTLGVTLDPDLSGLTAAERAAAAELLAAGGIMHRLYERQLHAESASALAALVELHAASAGSRATANLLELFYLHKGPVATTLDNQRLPFLPVRGEDPGKNVYPPGLTRAEIDSWLATHPDAARDILAVRTVVRRATAAGLAADLELLDAHPAVETLHSGLRGRLTSIDAADGFYAVPYALAYAPELATARRHLENAADLVAAESPDFAAYLRNRGRDFLSGDYESGDASWVSGDFAGLNFQVGGYETYDDNLLGVKAFYSASLLVRDEARSRQLEQAISELQAIEDSLPYASPKRVRERIPVGVYNVIADFGQARGANTATILPNDADFSRKYGRTILMRANILAEPAIFANRKRRFDAVISAVDRNDLSARGGFDRTLWHEIGHYLGPGRTRDGRELDAALADKADLYEELKADLVSLFAVPLLTAAGYHDADSARAQYADGVRRTLQDVRPRPAQPYQTMQLMQFNFFMENDLLVADPDNGLLGIDYDRYPEVITAMLAEVLRLQHEGNYAAAVGFVDRWSYWSDALHGRYADILRDAARYRRTLVRYAAISSASPAP
jgi:hypothetical protein